MEWRDVLWMKRANESAEKKAAAKRELVEWCRVEKEGMMLEREVNARIISAATTDTSSQHVENDNLETSPIPHTEEEGTNWQNNDRNLPRHNRSEKAPRSNRVTFSRDWEAWWIRDAIDEVVAASTAAAG